ncbi:hypothetical protein B0H11DRAFT_2366201 [Mycena galericulata]|nr:hypothetical protein B0H11DRAFT_2366201 [Mycena galericulata]
MLKTLPLPQALAVFLSVGAGVSAQNINSNRVSSSSAIIGFVMDILPQHCRCRMQRQSLRQSAAVKFAALVQPRCGDTHNFDGAGDDLNIATAAVCGNPAADKQLQILCSGSLRQLQRQFWHFAAAVLHQSAAVLRLSAAVQVVTQRQCDMAAAM